MTNRPARVLAVLNLKGGVGKTHTAWLLAGVCEERGRRCLLVDLDTQANLTSSFLDPDGQPGVERLFHQGFDGDARDLVRHTRFPHLDLIPSGPRLAPFDLSDRDEWEGAGLQSTLAEALAPLTPHYDYVILDCPPRLSLVSFAALCAADGVITPLEAADWGARGVTQVAAAVGHVAGRFNPRLRMLGYLVSRFKKSRVYQQQYLLQLRAHFGSDAFDTIVADASLFERSVTDRVPIVLYAPRSPAAAVARLLFDEVERRCAAGGAGVPGGGSVHRAALPPVRAG